MVQQTTRVNVNPELTMVDTPRSPSVEVTAEGTDSRERPSTPLTPSAPPMIEGIAEENKTTEEETQETSPDKDSNRQPNPQSKTDTTAEKDEFAEIKQILHEWQETMSDEEEQQTTHHPPTPVLTEDNPDEIPALEEIPTLEELVEREDKQHCTCHGAQGQHVIGCWALRDWIEKFQWRRKNIPQAMPELPGIYAALFIDLNS